MRDPESSHHDYDPAVADLRHALRARVKRDGDPLNEARAKALVESLVVAVEEKNELRVWRALKRVPARLATTALEHAITLIVGGGLVLLWHFLSARR